MKQLLNQIEEIWCTTMHSSVMWPYRGHYQCRECLREYPVPFEASAPRATVRREEAFTPAIALRRA